MKKEFTPDEIINNRGCYSFERVKKLSFINKDIITVEDVLNSEISLSDKLYFLRVNCNPEPDVHYSDFIISLIEFLKKLRKVCESHLGWMTTYYAACDVMELRGESDKVLKMFFDFVNEN